MLVRRPLVASSSFALLGFLAALVLGAGGSGCGSSSNSDAPSDAGGDAAEVAVDTALVDAAPDGPDRGAVSTVYPAFKVDAPQLIKNKGYVMKAPKVVTVTWAGNTAAARFEQFGDQIGASNYWKTAVGEYGVGPATSGADSHIRLPDTPPKDIISEDLDGFLSSKLNDATAGFPAPTVDTVYVFYISPETHVQANGVDGCSSFGGYHTSAHMTLADGDHDVAYAVIPDCPVGGNRIDSMIDAASHEIGEAATDPYPEGTAQSGYRGIDNDHFAWEILNQLQNENGDMCEFPYGVSDTTANEPLFAFPVQRLWSNASIAAGHDPCVPAPSSEPYFNMTLLDPEAITVNMRVFGRGNITTKGYSIAVGETKTFDVGFYSDAKTDPWTLEAVEGNGIFGTGDSGTLEIKVFGVSGQNGQKAQIRVKVVAPGSMDGPGGGSSKNVEMLTLISTNKNDTKHFLPIFISNPAP